jgi:DNA-binding NtrC family response regulator
VKLLRFLEERKFERVGGTEAVPVDVRIVAATNQNLEERVREGRFREDLYFRLNVVRIEVPPLRDRREDIPTLVAYFLDLARGAGITEEAMDALRNAAWPGNVRELKNAVHSAFILADHTIEPGMLPPTVREMPVTPDAGDSGDVLDVRVGLSIAEAERRLTLATLRSCGGKKDAAAKVLGISLKTLYNRLNLYRAQGQNIAEAKPPLNNL